MKNRDIDRPTFDRDNLSRPTTPLKKKERLQCNKFFSIVRSKAEELYKFICGNTMFAGN